MSVRIMSWVFEESQTLGGERLVALALADNADDHGRCWPSVARIAQKARVSRATVKRATAHMVELGEIERTDRGRRSNLYRFTCGVNMSPQDASESDVVGSNENLVGSSATGCGLTMSPRIIKEPSRTYRATTWPDDLTRPEGASAPEWDAFRDHHQAKGSRFVDWQAAWRTWLRRAKQFESAAAPRRRESWGALPPKTNYTQLWHGKG